MLLVYSLPVLWTGALYKIPDMTIILRNSCGFLCVCVFFGFVFFFWGGRFEGGVEYQNVRLAMRVKRMGFRINNLKRTGEFPGILRSLFD